MTSPEFEKVNELRSFRGSKKPVKCRFGCKMYCESRGGDLTEENYKNTWVFILWEEISMRVESMNAEERLEM